MLQALVIEDEAPVRCLLTTILHRAGYRVIEAKDGNEGINSLATQVPDVVVTDIFMPGSDGIEVLQEIRRQGKNPRVVAISGGSPRMQQLDFLDMAMKLGADAVVSKPFTPYELLKAVAGDAAEELCMRGVI